MSRTVEIPRRVLGRVVPHDVGDSGAEPPLFSNPSVQDALIAGALTATSLVGVWTRLSVEIPEGAADETVGGLGVLGITLLLGQTIPLVWRRRAPVAVLAVITSALFLFSVLGYFRSFAAFGFLIALYTVAAHRERRTSIPAGIAAGAMVLLVLVIGPEPVEPDAVIAMCLIVGSAWFIGDAYRVRRGEFVLLEDRATRLEREREELARQAVAAERRVIARELHDVVAHNVSVIVAQAGAAQRISASDPDEALATLGVIERTGREALVEMRRLTGFLRTDRKRRDPRSPQPGMADLDALVAQVRQAGLPVTLRIEGDPQPLPAGLDLSAFRIVQEATTNVLKHAGGPSSVAVTIRYLPSRLSIEVADDGIGARDRSAQPLRPRYGHLGMRERVALFGGELTVGPRPGGGYRVAASLPLDQEP
jgi:signal transduction histidine kinase